MCASGGLLPRRAAVSRLCRLNAMYSFLTFLSGDRLYQGTIHKEMEYRKLPIESEERLRGLDRLRIDDVGICFLHQTCSTLLIHPALRQHHTRRFHFGSISSTDDQHCAAEDRQTIEQVGCIDIALSPLKSCRPRKASDPEDWWETPAHELLKPLYESEKKVQFALAAS